MNRTERRAAMNQINDPLADEAPEEVPLPNAPLVRVVAQVRYSTVLKIKKEDFISDFQDKLRVEYPTLKNEQTSSILMGPGGPHEITQETVWRFYDESENWRLSLAPSFVAVETLKYSSRDDFLNRVRYAVEAVSESFAPGLVTRLGVRYIARVADGEFERIEELIRDEMLGIVKSAIRPRGEHSISEVKCTATEGNMTVRWGILPANATHDPSMMDPVDQPSWILDLDVFRTFAKESGKFDIDLIMEISRLLANRAYTFFRWSVKEEFLKAYGGAP